MARGLNGYRCQDPTFLLMYSALQFGPEEMAKPDGSLSLPYLAGAVRRAGYDVKILDVSVDGLLHIDSLRDDQYEMEDDGLAWRGRRSNRRG